jgi:hypothetical protein
MLREKVVTKETLAADPDIVDERDAAKFTGMSVAFLRVGRAQGVVGRRTPSPPYIRLGRAIRYDKNDLRAWLLEHRRVPGAPPPLPPVSAAKRSSRVTAG